MSCSDCGSESRPLYCATNYKNRALHSWHGGCNCRVRCCTTCWRARKARNRHREQGRQVRKYDITPEQYDAICEAQGRKCAIDTCNAQGKSRRLCIDHDHACAKSHGDVVKACCVRGLLCKRCNSTLGDYRDEPLAFISFTQYLYCPPAVAVLGTQDAHLARVARYAKNHLP